MGSAASVEASEQLKTASVADLRAVQNGLSPAAREKINTALMEVLARSAALNEIPVNIAAELMSGEKVTLAMVLGDTVSDLKARLAEQMDVPSMQVRLVFGSRRISESGQLVDELFQDRVAAACRSVMDEQSETAATEEEIQRLLVEACRRDLEATVQVAVVSVVTVSTEEELKNAVAGGARSIRIPDDVEITLQEKRELPKQDQEGEEEEEETDKPAPDEEDEEEDKEFEAVPMTISRDLEIIGGSGSVLRQESYASTGVRDECALLVDGASVSLEDITLDRGGVRIVNGGSVSSARCRVINAGWFVSGSTSSLQLDQCSMQGGITKCIGLSEGALAAVSDSTFKDGGCWSANIVAEGPGSKMTLTKCTIANCEGWASLAVSEGASLTCEGGSVTTTPNNLGLAVEGKDSSALMKNVVLEGTLEESGSDCAGIEAKDGGEVTVEGVTVRNFGKGIVCRSGAKVSVTSATLDQNDIDYLQAGGVINDIASELILEASSLLSKLDSSRLEPWRAELAMGSQPQGLENMKRWQRNWTMPCARLCCFSPDCASQRCSACSGSISKSCADRAVCMGCELRFIEPENPACNDVTGYQLCRTCLVNTAVLHEHDEFCLIDGSTGEHAAVRRLCGLASRHSYRADMCVLAPPLPDGSLCKICFCDFDDTDDPPSAWPGCRAEPPHFCDDRQDWRAPSGVASGTGYAHRNCLMQWISVQKLSYCAESALVELPKMALLCTTCRWQNEAARWRADFEIGVAMVSEIFCDRSLLETADVIELFQKIAGNVEIATVTAEDVEAIGTPMDIKLAST